MKKFAYIAIWGIIVFLCAACNRHGSENSIDDETVWVNLDINVSLSDLSAPDTRAGYEQAANGDELMHTLRILVVRPDNTVEENRFVSFSSYLIHYGYERFKVAANEKKQIYLFVNEKTAVMTGSASGATRIVNLATWLSNIRKGEKFPVEDLTDLTICLDGNSKQISRPLPMSECHEVEVNDVDSQADLFITRAAVKFSFYITNQSDRNKTLTGLSIDHMAGQGYYLPNHVEYIDKTEDGVTYKEIKSYEVPSEPKYYTYEMGRSDISLHKNKQVPLAPIYLLEGKYVDDAAGGKNYAVHIGIDGVNLSGVLDQLPQLPRNTHVKVYITIKNTTINCEVDIRPYTEVILDPDFGL